MIDEYTDEELESSLRRAFVAHGADCIVIDSRQERAEKAEAEKDA